MAKRTNKLKKIAVCLSFSAMLLSSQVHAKNACESLLCMAGVSQGVGVVSGCSGPVKDYFNITKTKKGKFSASRTSNARGSYLNSCAAGNTDTAAKVNQKYGRMRSFGF